MKRLGADEGLLSVRVEDDEVLVEGEHKGKWRGRTPGNKLVFFADPHDWTGRLARIHVTQTGPWSLQGNLLGEGVPA